MAKDKTLLVFCTCPSREAALKVADQVVGEHLAACVNVLPDVQSVFRWQGEVHHDPEVLMMLKTTGRRYPELEQRIRALHPYELPEIIAVDIERGLKGYMDWIAKSMRIAPRTH